MYPFFKLKMADADSVGSEDVFSEMDSAVGPTFLNFDQIGQLGNGEVVAFHNEKLKHDDPQNPKTPNLTKNAKLYIYINFLIIYINIKLPLTLKMTDHQQEANMYDMQNINHEDSQRIYDNQENF